MSPSYDARRFGDFDFGPFQHDPNPADGTVRLYHGTSDKAAERIRIEGFDPTDFDAIVAQIAHRFDTEAAVIKKRLSEYGSFHAVRTQYDDPHIYFTDSPLHAELWARWGGEARIEAICAVIAVQRCTEDIVPEDDPEVVSFLSHTPWVLAFDIPYDSLHGIGHPLSAVPLEDHQPTGPHGSFGRILDCMLPAGSGDWHLVSAHPVERVWEVNALERDLGLKWGTLPKWVEAGTFPRPDEHFLARQYWWQSTLDQARDLDDTN